MRGVDRLIDQCGRGEERLVSRKVLQRAEKEDIITPQEHLQQSACSKLLRRGRRSTGAYKESSLH